MKQKLYLILILFLLPVVTFCQTTDILNKVAEQSAENTVKELKNLKQDDEKRIITVVPFLSSNSKYTKISKEFTKKYVELLNKEIAKANLKFSATGENFSNSEFTDLLYKTNIKTVDWTAYLNKYKPQYIIKGNYKVDEQENKLYFENVTIYNNWMEEKFINKISVKDVSIDMFNKYVTHSVFIPGLGQVKRGQKSKGYTIMTFSGITLAGAIVSEAIRQNMLSKAIRNPYSTVYKDNAASFGTVRTASLIGFGATYIFNIASAIAYKPKNRYSKNISFVPYFTKEQFCFTLSFKVN